MVIKKLMTDGKLDLEKVTHFAKEIVEQLNDGTYRIDICGYVFDREHTRVRDGIYLSTMRLARKMRTIKRQHNGYMGLKDCQSLVSKAGWAEHANSVSMLHEIDPPCEF